jgi:hypothetical protein
MDTDRRSANYYYSRRRARTRPLGRYSSPDAYDRNRRPAWRRQVDYSATAEQPGASTECCVTCPVDARGLQFHPIAP